MNVKVAAGLIVMWLTFGLFWSIGALIVDDDIRPLRSAVIGFGMASALAAFIAFSGRLIGLVL